MDHTNNICHWFLLRSLEQTYLETVHQFYIYGSEANCSLLITHDDKVYHYGKDLFQQDSSSDHAHDAPQVRHPPEELVELSGQMVTQVASGFQHIMALSRNGNLYGWGVNQQGQVGVDGFKDQPKPILVMRNVRMVRCGYAHTMALDTSDKVWIWGWNEYHQLGGDSTADCSSPVELMVLSQKKVVELQCGNLNCMALTEEHQLYIWGRFGTPMTHKKPTRLSFSSEFTIFDIAPGFDNFLVLNNFGQVYRCYYNKIKTFRYKLVKTKGLIQKIYASRYEDIALLISVNKTIFIWDAPRVIETTIVSLSDAHSLYGHYSTTPQITTLPLSAINSDYLKWLNSFQNPNETDLKLCFRFRSTTHFYKPIYVRSDLLKQRSSYFDRMLETDWKEQASIKFETNLYSIYFSLLYYLHTKQLVLDFDLAFRFYDLVKEQGHEGLCRKSLQIITDGVAKNPSLISLEKELFPFRVIVPCNSCDANLKSSEQNICSTCHYAYCIVCVEIDSGICQCKRCLVFSSLRLSHKFLEQLKEKDLQWFLISKKISFNNQMNKEQLISVITNHASEISLEQTRQNLERTELAESRYCKICMEKPANCALIECGHLLACTECGKNLTNCPLCRCSVTRFIRIYEA